MKLAIIIIYTLGCLVAAILSDMVIEANFSTMHGDNYDKKQMSERACMYSLGSWLAVAYIWKTERASIKYTWRKWTKQL